MYVYGCVGVCEVRACVCMCVQKVDVMNELQGGSTCNSLLAQSSDQASIHHTAIGFAGPGQQGSILTGE